MANLSPAAARGTRVHSLMEEYLLGVEKNPVIDDPEIEAFWKPSSLNLYPVELDGFADKLYRC